MELIKFSREGCVPCQILGLYLEDKGVTYQEKSIEDLPMYGLSLDSVPILLVVEDDSNVVVDLTVGFNPSNPTEVNKLLELI